MKHENPLVSVVIPCYNAAELVSDTIDSVIHQTYKNWEAIIVDDDSTDSSLEILKKYSSQNKNITSLKRERLPKGGNTCRNIGLSKAKGLYIIFLDADDLLAPWCIEQRIKIMNNYPDLSFGVFKMDYFKESVSEQEDHSYKNIKDPLNHFIGLENIWQITGPIWNKEFLISIHGFNENYKRLQDVELAFRALTNQNVQYKLFYEMPADCFYRRGSKQLDVNFWLNGYMAVEQYIDQIYSWLITQRNNKTYKKYFIRTIYNYIIYWWRSEEKRYNEKLITQLYKNRIIHINDLFVFRISIFLSFLKLNKLKFSKTSVELFLRAVKIFRKSLS